MQTQEVKIKDLIPAPYNPRKWPEKAIKDLKKSIQEFGLVDPLIVNSAPGRKNILIGGHFRLKIAKDLGYKTVPVVYVNIPTEKKEKELNLRLNKNLGIWDWELLGDFDEEILIEAGFDDFDIENIFFDDKMSEYGKDKDKFHTTNDPGWENSGAPDGIPELVGYDLLSVWDVIEDCDTETGKYFLPLPLNQTDKSRNRIRYSRTHPDELEKIVRTYMRPGDFFLESCVGWASFSSVAKFYGYSGIGIDIWETSLKYCEKQLETMPGKGKVEIKKMDALDLKFEDNKFDIVYSNPPFYNLEGYKQTADDISVNKTYDEWLGKIKKMSIECYRVLKPGGLAIFTMADFRKDGILVDAHNYWIQISKEVGFVLWDHAIQKIKSISIVTRKRNYARRYCVKGAEHIMVFKKPKLFK